ncbi:unnamed protein product [Ilex paraguariensis]|uniref:Uncharacterized protein n=1 Tax=Ilex paraguariensis TaxID=185542 RepID=A0ABC8UX77_9AQUA
MYISKERYARLPSWQTVLFSVPNWDRSAGPINWPILPTRANKVKRKDASSKQRNPRFFYFSKPRPCTKRKPRPISKDKTME